MAEMNAFLAGHNGELTRDLLNPTHVFIDVCKSDPKKRQKPPLVVGSYCPFCGEKYQHTRAFVMATDTDEKPAALTSAQGLPVQREP